VVTGAGISVTAMMPSSPSGAQDSFGANATSGAGGGSVGVAGSLAINLGQVRTDANVSAGATLTSTGTNGITIKAVSNTADTANAQPMSSSGTTGSSVGIGASVAINVIDETTEAWIGDASVPSTQGTITSGGDVSVSASSTSAITTGATGGAAGSVTVVPVAAVTIANLDTLAEVQGTGGFTAGNLTISATHLGTASNTATGNTTASSVGIGASVSVGIVADTTTAMLTRSAGATAAR
jgi:hypothetical protein